MSDVISFRADEDMADEIRREMENDPDDPSRSEATKRLVREAVDARRIPLWLRVGMSDRRAAQIEALRREGEDDADVARELLAEAIEQRQADVLDAIGVGDELREKIQQKREEGETLEAAVTRLIRESAERKERTYLDEVKLTASIATIMILSIALTVYTGAGSALLVVTLMAIYSLTYPIIAPIVAKRFDM